MEGMRAQDFWVFARWVCLSLIRIVSFVKSWYWYTRTLECGYDGILALYFFGKEVE
jgi:hypothetical protein